MSHLKKYVDYIRNTRRVPLPTAMFDADWDPIGPKLRREMVAAGLIVETPDGIVIA